MERKGFTRGLRDLALALAVSAFTAGPSFAHEVWLVARQFNKAINLPAGGTVSVQMWGFASDADHDLITDGGETPSVPGPMITVPDGDGTLTIHLRNDLSGPTGEDVSIVIPGQTAALSPVRFSDGQGRDRVSSFTNVVAKCTAAPCPTQDYTWTGLKPGTYLYHSGTHVAVQMQMGLYGAMKKDASIGNVYPGKAYTNELVLVYSEIDPDLHAAVVAGNYGPGKPVTSTFNYKPQHFLINGQPFTAGQAALAAGNSGQTLLIRFLNAGLKTHVPVLHGSYMSLIAEDGNAYPYARQDYSVLLPAGKTADALWTPTANGNYPLIDASLHLTTAGATGGGMLTLLNVGGGGGPVNTPPTVNAGGDQIITLPASASLDGTVSDDGLLLPAPTTTWTPTSGPGTVTFGNASLVDTTASFSVAGNYVLRLTANDGQYTPFDEVAIAVNPAPATPVQLYFSTLGDSSVPGVVAPYDDADIYAWNGTSFSRVFDGSTAGLAGGADIDALQVVDADTFYMSFAANGGTTVPGLGSVQDEDVVLYDAGTWILHFDGSDVGLDPGNNNEDVDAFDILGDGSVVVSTTGGNLVPGIATTNDDSDLVRCVGSFGPTTTCTWSVYFDGSDVALSAGTEDVDGVAVSDTTIYLSSLGAFSVTGLSGAGEDVFACNAATTGAASACGSLTMYFDGSGAGLPPLPATLVPDNVDAFDVP